MLAGRNKNLALEMKLLTENEMMSSPQTLHLWTGIQALSRISAPLVQTQQRKGCAHALAWHLAGLGPFVLDPRIGR